LGGGTNQNKGSYRFDALAKGGKRLSLQIPLAGENWGKGVLHTRKENLDEMGVYKI